MSPRAAALALLVAVASAGALFLALRTAREPREAAPAGAAPALLPAALDEVARVDARALPEATAAPAGGLTARTYLADYYGASWPALAQRMEAKGVRLDAPYVPQPWARARAQIEAEVPLDEATRANLVRARLRWTEVLTNEWLRDAFALARGVELTPAELAELEARLAPDRQAIELASELYCDHLDLLLRQAFAQERYVRGPYTSAGLDDRTGVFSKAIAGGSWGVTLTLTAEEHPELVQLDQEILALVQARDRRVSEFLRAHRPR